MTSRKQPLNYRYNEYASQATFYPTGRYLKMTIIRFNLEIPSVWNKHCNFFSTVQLTLYFHIFHKFDIYSTRYIQFN